MYNNIPIACKEYMDRMDNLFNQIEQVIDKHVEKYAVNNFQIAYLKHKIGLKLDMQDIMLNMNNIMAEIDDARYLAETEQKK